MDWLWQYYGPGRFTWGTAEPEGSGEEEVADHDEEEVAGQVAEAI